MRPLRAGRQRVTAPSPPARAGNAGNDFRFIYDIYRGVVNYVRVVDGKITPLEKVAIMSTGSTHELLAVGIVSPDPKARVGLCVGGVGYLITGVKNVRQSKVGRPLHLPDQVGRLAEHQILSEPLERPPS